MNYTFCKSCENEFDLDEIGEDNLCPHCDSEYEWMQDEEEIVTEFLADDGDWE